MVSEIGPLPQIIIGWNVARCWQDYCSAMIARLGGVRSSQISRHGKHVMEELDNATKEQIVAPRAVLSLLRRKVSVFEA